MVHYKCEYTTNSVIQIAHGGKDIAKLQSKEVLKQKHVKIHEHHGKGQIKANRQQRAEQKNLLRICERSATPQAKCCQ